MTMLNVKIEFHIYIHKDVAVNSLQPSSVQHEPAVEQKEPLKRIASLSMSEYARRQARLAFRKGRFSTARNYLTALRSFLRFHEGQDIPLSGLTASLLADYERWLKANCKSMGTLSCYLRSLRAIYNKAVEEGLVADTHPFAKSYTGYPKTDKRSITVEEIRRISRLPLEEKGYIRLVRDIFLFCVFACGMPFVDVAFLRKSQIEDGRLVYHRRKTNQRISFQLPPCAMDIVRRYQDTDSAYVFPILTTEDPEKAYRQYKGKLCYYNRLLKELASRAGIRHNLTSYVSRHSWASLAYEQNTEVSVISKGLGHASPNTTMVYIKGIDDDRLNEANNRLVHSILQEEGAPRKHRPKSRRRYSS
mgnify:FL=1